MSPVLQDVVIIIVLSAAFGLMGFVYSLVDFTQPPHRVVSLEVFRSLTVQEIGGHFLFGFVPAAVATRNLRIAVLVGLMALTIDADHALNLAKLPVQGRLDHSIIFTLLSAPVMGLIAAYVIVQNNTRLLLRPQQPQPRKVNNNTGSYHNDNSVENRVAGVDINANQNSKRTAISARYVFIQFSIITVAAVLTHIAYDVFVDDAARFPLLNPFNFGQIIIPRVLTIPIEAAGFLVIYFCYAYFRSTASLQ